MDQTKTYDVAVVGAGAAGLQAALTLGRMHKRTVVLGTDRYRNDPAEHMHNFLGHDGTPPAALRVAARADLERYATVELVDREVVSISGEPGAFTLELAGSAPVVAQRVLLATGVVDEVPDVPGLRPLFGDVVAHCPFCHGHEFTGTRVGVLGVGPHLPRFAGMLAPIATGITVLTGGEPVDAETAGQLRGLGVDVRTERVLGVCRGPAGVTVELDGAPTEELGGLFVRTEWRQATPFAEQLGLELSPVGAVVVDAMGHTSRDGVYAAGDLAQGPGLPMPLSSVLTSAAGGLVAASACVHDGALELAVARPEDGRAA